jgi:hypothetical protein
MIKFFYEVPSNRTYLSLCTGDPRIPRKFLNPAARGTSTRALILDHPDKDISRE